MSHSIGISIPATISMNLPITTRMYIVIFLSSPFLIFTCACLVILCKQVAQKPWVKRIVASGEAPPAR